MSIHYKTTADWNFLETADAVTAATIKGAKIVYRPGGELKNMLKTLKYEKKA
ncbi:MAG: hypothetical protein IH598_02290 [Bacteroidales bacterium]|nr:hypothetical protein [Bacteroidales bacterium]